MKRLVSFARGGTLALTICVCLCGGSACSKSNLTATSGEKANPAASPQLLLPQDCRLAEDEVKMNVSFIDDAANYAIYALLSNNAYERGQEEIFRLPAQEWRQKSDFTPEGTETGLALKVFEKVADDKPVEVVIAFRGTDDRKDWWQNLAPQFLFPQKRQTDLAEKNFERLRGLYEGQNVRYFATGHSLGGGLALHLSFKYPNVAAVAFNSSPRVGRGPKSLRNANARVIIWESKEALSYFRSIHNPFLGTVKEIKFNFQRGLKGSVKQHGMYALALNMLKLGCETSLPPAALLKPLLSENCRRS
jgi:hypothetical protein